MKRFLRLFFIPFMTGLFLMGAWRTLEAQIPPNNVMCPVMIGNRAKEKFFADYQNKRIYMCCRSCVKSFKKNPAKYLKRMEKKAV